MNLLNEDYFAEILTNKEDFLNTKPFPFLNKKGIFKEGMRDKLLAWTPEPESDPARKDNDANIKKYQCFDINNIEIELNDIWKSFIDDFKSDIYVNFVTELFDIKGDWDFHLEWASTNNFGNRGRLPHPDVKTKKGTNLFYLNDESWNQDEWGGRTGIVGDFVGLGNIISYRNDPEKWGDITYANMDNECIIFKVSKDSWHFIEPVNHPETGWNRKIFFINPIQDSRH